MRVSDARQINDLDHDRGRSILGMHVSDACQINDLDHRVWPLFPTDRVEAGRCFNACRINDLDIHLYAMYAVVCFRCLSD